MTKEYGPFGDQQRKEEEAFAELPLHEKMRLYKERVKKLSGKESQVNEDNLIDQPKGEE